MSAASVAARAERLEDSVYSSRATVRDSEARDDMLVLVFGWWGCKPRHVQK